jgi:hypothetical protein
MISGANARRVRRKNGNHAQRMILNNLLRGDKTQTAGADHPPRQSKERSGVILENGIDGLLPSGFGHGLEAHFVPSEDGVEFPPWIPH